MAKKSKLDRCVRCKEHHAQIGVVTSYYGVGNRGKKQIKGSSPCARILFEVLPEAGQERRLELSATR
jgi:hypothetical protein